MDLVIRNFIKRNKERAHQDRRSTATQIDDSQKKASSTVPVAHIPLLIRRQLLNMERERTNLAKIRAEDDVKRYQEHLHALEMRVVPASDRPWDDWFSDDLRIARAWSRLFESSNYYPSGEISLSNIFSDDNSRVAFVLGGGAGDLLKATTLLPALSRRFGRVHFFVDNVVARQILEGNPYVASLTLLKCNPYQFAREVLHFLPIFDLVACWRYAVSYALPPRSRMEADDIKALLAQAQLEGRTFEKYHFVNDVWPIFNNGFGRDMMTARRGVIDISGATSALGVDRNSPLLVFPNAAASNIARLHRGRSYVTIHHGFDPNHLPGKTVQTSYGSTKNLPLSIWEKVIAGLSSRGFDVIQLGTSGETPLPGVRYVYNGQTSFAETALVIKGAACHIDTEGGLVHLARAVHTTSVVLFGPTPVEVFGYDQNINITPMHCSSCWYTTHNWVVQCPRLTEGPQCMEEHEPDKVLAAVDLLISRKTSFKFEWIEFPLDDDSVATPNQILSPFVDVEASDSLRITPADIANKVAGRLSLVSLTESLEDSPAAQRCAQYASSLNLPLEDAAYDIICMELGHFAASKDTASEILLEACRVLRPDGMLLIMLSSEDQKNGGFAEIEIGNIFSALELATSATQSLKKNAFLFQKVVNNAAKSTEYAHNHNDVSVDEAPNTAAQDLLKLEISEIRQAVSSDLDAVERLLRKREATDDEIWRAKTRLFETLHMGDGWIEFKHTEMDAELRHLLVDGWHPTETWGVWGAGSRHTLVLPISELLRSCDLEVEIEFRLVELPAHCTQEVIVSDGCIEVGRLPVGVPAGICRLEVPGERLIADSCLQLVFHVSRPVVPSMFHASLDDRVLGVGLSRARCRAMQQLT